MDVRRVRRQASALAARHESGAGAPALPQLSQLLAGVIEHVDAFEAVWHPLGCLYLELCRDAERSVRFHVWCRAQDGPDIVHSHDFDMCSVVLAGSLANSVYELDFGAGTIPLLDIDYAEGGEVLRPSGVQVACRRLETRTLVAGQSYRLRAGRFHSVRPQQGLPAATFVSTRRVPSCTGQVLAYAGTDAGADTGAAARPRCSRDEKLAALRPLVSCTADADGALASARSGG